MSSLKSIQHEAFCAPISVSTSSFSARHGMLLNRRPVICRRSRAVPSCSISTPSPERSFGRGERFPRRLVGLYELERLGIDPSKLFTPNQGSQRGFSLAIALGVIATFGVPAISPWVQIEGPVALVIGGFLFMWAFDTLSLGGILQRAAAMTLQNNRRVAIHEAGHFLVAYLLGINVEKYELPTAGAMLKGSEVGVQLKEANDADAYVLAALGMSGVAAECVLFGDSQGGEEDLSEVNRIAAGSGPFGKASQQEKKVMVRWALIQAVSLITAHKEALEKLATAMSNNASVEDCTRIIDESVDTNALRAQNDASKISASST